MDFKTFPVLQRYPSALLNMGREMAHWNDEEMMVGAEFRCHPKKDLYSLVKTSQTDPFLHDRLLS